MAERDSPIVLNLTKDMELNPEFLIGEFVDRETRHEGGVVREIVEWYPKDAVKKDESERLVRTSVKPGNVLEYGPGMISPRQIYVLLPDKYSELPKAIKENGSDENPFATLGLFFQEVHYQKLALIESLEIATDQEPEIMENIRTLVKSSELDDERILRFERLLDRIEERAKNQSKNSSSTD